MPRTARILEIGPSYNPIAPKAQGWNAFALDHMSQDELRAKYRTEPLIPADRIEPVDFVWRDGPLSEAVPPDQRDFDVFIASHVIEHTPDLIAFLDSAAALLAPDGLMILVVPDLRWCFDCLQPPTTTGQLLLAHSEGRTRHTPGIAYDHAAYAVTDGGLAAWWPRRSEGLAFQTTLKFAAVLFDHVKTSPDYVDLHAWRFVPASFSLILLELARLGHTDWRIEHSTPGLGAEFIVRLRRGGRAEAEALTEPELDTIRLTHMRQTLKQLRDMIDRVLDPEG